jgi:hypothetical protein
LPDEQREYQFTCPVCDAWYAWHPRSREKPGHWRTVQAGNTIWEPVDDQPARPITNQSVSAILRDEALRPGRAPETVRVLNALADGFATEGFDAVPEKETDHG